MHFCIFTSMRQLLIYILRSVIFIYYLPGTVSSISAIQTMLLSFDISWEVSYAYFFQYLNEIQVRKRFPPYVLDHFTNLTKTFFHWNKSFGRYDIELQWDSLYMRNFLVTQRHWGSTYNFLETLQIRSGRNLNLFVSKKLDKYLLALTKNKYL